MSDDSVLSCKTWRRQEQKQPKNKELINSPQSALSYEQKGNIIIGKSAPVIIVARRVNADKVKSIYCEKCKFIYGENRICGKQGADMTRENDRENLTEMEQIHRGLEAFLEKEVYEEYEAGQDAEPEEYGRDADRDGYEYEENGDEEYAGGEYGDGYEYEGYGDEEYEDGEYEDEEPVSIVTGRQSVSQARSREKSRGVQPAGREQSRGAQTQSREKGRGAQLQSREKSRAAQPEGREQSRGAQPQSRVKSRAVQPQSGGTGKSAQARGSEKGRAVQTQDGGKGRGRRKQGGGKGQASRQQGNGSAQPARKKKHRILRRFLTVVLVLLLALTALWYVSVSYLYDKVEYAPTDILADEPMKEEGVTNILLIGNDSRENGGDGRSDAMILVSISNRTQTIYLTSLLRDIYVEIPGHESNRLNAAYAFGGPELLLETVKQNFDIEVNRYVQVNFQAFANLIDAVGGVDLELTNEEVQLVNAYLNEYNMLENRPMDTDYLPADASGMLHLNGPQALAYSRNRYIGSDFGRTERQRKILEAVFRQLPSSVLTNLDDMIDGILPNLTTNISKSECYLLSLDASKLLTYELVQASIPIEGSYQNATIRKMSVLQVDFEKNKAFIRTQIYGEDDIY